MSAAAILKLQAAGFSVEQVTALAEVIDTQAASKSDLLEVEHRLEGKIEHAVGAVKADVLVLKRMMGFVLAPQVAIFGKLFLH